MTTTHAARGLVWIDLSSPTEEEITSLVQRYDLHPLVGEELRSTPSSARVDIHKEYIMIVLNFPVRTKKDGVYTIVNREVDFVIGKNFLITSHAEPLEQLEYFGKIFETNKILQKDSRIDHTGHLFYYMVMRLYAGMCEDLENVRDAIMKAEDLIFGGDERRMVRALSELSRELIDFREAARVHRDIWEELMEQDGTTLFGQDFTPYVKDIRDEFTRIHELISASRELVHDLRDTNDSLLNTTQNDIMKTLTIINFIFIPATFIAALFTIPASFVPLVGSDTGWAILLGIMVVITVGIWLIVKRKKWL